MPNIKNTRKILRKDIISLKKTTNTVMLNKNNNLGSDLFRMPKKSSPYPLNYKNNYNILSPVLANIKLRFGMFNAKLNIMKTDAGVKPMA